MWGWDVVACIAGLVALALAADHLVLGSSTLAARWGVAPLAVGVVVIGIGTSMPELLTSALAAAGGSAEVGAGNVVGSNLTNLTLVLGVAALTAPIRIRSRILRREVPLAAAASAVFAVTLMRGLSALEGVVLLALMVASMLVMLRWSRDGDALGAPLVDDVQEVVEDEVGRSTRFELLRALGGLLGTLAGAQLLVTGALGIAGAAGLSGGAVGLTIVATGTSLPELVTALQASRRGESDLVVGNVLGSNISASSRWAAGAPSVDRVRIAANRDSPSPPAPGDAGRPTRPGRTPRSRPASRPISRPGTRARRRAGGMPPDVAPAGPGEPGLSTRGRGGPGRTCRR